MIGKLPSGEGLSQPSIRISKCGYIFLPWWVMTMSLNVGHMKIHLNRACCSSQLILCSGNTVLRIIKIKQQKTFTSGPTNLHVKFDPSSSMQVAPLKHSELLKAASLHTSISFSQVFPVYPSLQKHANLSMRSTHEPPFKQGLEAQSCEWKVIHAYRSQALYQ